MLLKELKGLKWLVLFCMIGLFVKPLSASYIDSNTLNIDEGVMQITSESIKFNDSATVDISIRTLHYTPTATHGLITAKALYDYIVASFNAKVIDVNTVPKGGIIIWSGSETDIPGGYVLCDGGINYGYTAPDLRSRFIRGATALGSYGGVESHQITTAEMPSHRHSFYGKSTTSGTSETWGGNSGFLAVGTTAGTSGSFGKVINDAGNGNYHNNMPPYYVLCYIMRVR